MAGSGTLVVGLTGGIGSGKSRVADLLRELGAAVECSDLIVREIQAPGSPALSEIAEALGDEYLTPNGELDRPRLGERVFEDAEARKTLGNIIHPRVFGELKERLEKHRRAGARVVILDIPLLLEGRASGKGSGALIPFDLILLVYADPETQVRRVIERDSLSEADARARVAAQMPIEEKRALADVVLDNGGSWEATAAEVRELYGRWLSEGGPSEPPR